MNRRDLRLTSPGLRPWTFDFGENIAGSNCRVSDWNGSWYAIHNPATGSGLIVRRGGGGPAADLWVDQDTASDSNASSVLLLAPQGAEIFVAQRGNGAFGPSLSLPPGC